MDIEQRQKIYNLLAQYYPNAKQLKDSTTLTAWGLVLEKFPYEDVKNAVLNYVAAGKKYFPDLPDLTAGLTYKQPVDDMRERLNNSSQAKEQMIVVERYQAALELELAKHGLSPFCGATGKELNIWRQQCLDAGVDLDAILRRSFFPEGSGES